MVTGGRWPHSLFSFAGSAHFMLLSPILPPSPIFLCSVTMLAAVHHLQPSRRHPLPSHLSHPAPQLPADASSRRLQAGSQTASGTASDRRSSLFFTVAVSCSLNECFRSLSPVYPDSRIFAGADGMRGFVSFEHVDTKRRACSISFFLQPLFALEPDSLRPISNHPW